MKCRLCGLVYEGEHACAATIDAGTRTPGAAPEGFVLWRYLGLAWRIVRWDDAAAREVIPILKWGLKATIESRAVGEGFVPPPTLTLSCELAIRPPHVRNSLQQSVALLFTF
jgi:hypothetical protein